MNILMYGAGALGAYFGGRLLEKGHNIYFFVREKRALQLQKEGLHIDSPQGDLKTSDLTLFTDPEEVKNIDLIILAIKGYHLNDALPQIEMIQKNNQAFVLPLLNGMEHIPRLQETLGEEYILGGFASMIATLNEKGHVVHSNQTSSITFGTLHPRQKNICASLADIGEGITNTTIQFSDHIKKLMWRKYTFITAFSGVTTATNLPAGFIAKHDATYEVAKNVVEEMAEIAAKDGIRFTKEEIEQIAENQRQMPKESTSSMHQDFRKGLPIEVEHLHGGALRFAEKYGVQAPTIQTIYGLLKPYEHGRIDL